MDHPMAFDDQPTLRSAVFLGPIAVTTEHWLEHQPDGSAETGCRVELRRTSHLEPSQPPPSPRRDAVFWAVTDHLWRADLFSLVGGERRFDAAHYHPTFSGLVPCERVFDPGIVHDPYAWIERRLADIPAMLAESGHAELATQLDLEAVQHAMPAILATIRMTLAYEPPRQEHPLVEPQLRHL